MRIYIAGPMRGYPDHNFPAFYDIENWLRAKGYETLNPARADDETGLPVGSIGVAEALTRDAAMVASADAIYLLHGWEYSEGALVEWQLAKALHLQIFYQGGIEDYEWKDAINAN